MTERCQSITPYLPPGRIIYGSRVFVLDGFFDWEQWTVIGFKQDVHIYQWFIRLPTTNMYQVVLDNMQIERISENCLEII